jgi:hypothetical protein
VLFVGVNVVLADHFGLGSGALVALALLDIVVLIAVLQVVGKKKGKDAGQVLRAA